jgi:hypothetical protein
MRRWAFAIALAVAVLVPIPSPAGEAEGSGDEAEAASTPAAEGEAAAPEDAPEADEGEAAAPQDAPEASEDGAVAPEEAAAEKGKASEAEGEGEAEEESFFAPLGEYASNVSTQFLTGLNGLLTWPADPVMATVNPPKALDKAGYVRRPLGFASGLLLMAYRTFTGTLDLALAPGPLPVLSPVPRYKLVPGFEHEDE